MEKKDIIVGLDIGTTKICVMVGTRNEHQKIEILGLGKAESAGVTRGVVSNIEKTVQGILEAVTIASEKSGCDIKVVHVGIAGQHIKSLQHGGILIREKTQDEISKKDIEKLIEDMHRLVMPPGEDIIHVLPQEFKVDNEPGIKDPVGMAGVRLEASFHIFTGQITAAQNIVKCVNKAGLSTEAIILEPLASAEAVLSLEEKEAGVVLVDIGGGTTDIAIFHEGIIRHTAVIPFGGNVVTEDIREGCTVMKKQAEVLKIRFGSALADENQENEIISIPGLRDREPKEISVKNLANIIQARMEEIIDHIYFEIKSSGYEKKLIAGIVLTGGGSQLKHLKHLVEYSTGMNARIGYPNEHISGSYTEENSHFASPMYATAIGLVIKGFQDLDEKAGKSFPETQKREHSERDSWFHRMIKKGMKFLDGDLDEQEFKEYQR